jgi:uracil-DNA glycosylase
VTAPAQSDPPGAAGIDPADALAAVLDWWREAGVDHAFGDDPRTWLAAPAEEQPVTEQRAAPPPPAFVAPATPPAERIAGLGALPATLPEFHAWWLAEPSLDGGNLAGRIAPRGAAGAELMVLIDHPEAEDRDRLLSGPQGRLLDGILRALGLTADAAYLAACLPRHMPLPDWAALDAAGLGEVTRHHIALAKPRRLLVLGRHISPLLGHDPTKSAEPLRHFNHESRTIPLLVGRSLAALAGQPRGKAGLWQALLDWTGRD